jgi:hypothetical protein
MITFGFFTGKTKPGRFAAVVFLAGFLTAVFFDDASWAANRVYPYVLGGKEYIDKLYPKKGTNGYPLSTGKIIEDFLKQSLAADHIPYKSVKVSVINIDVKGIKLPFYHVTIVTDDSERARAASYYGKIQPKILGKNIAGQALKGVNDCRAAGDDCWNPLRG